MFLVEHVTQGLVEHTVYHFSFYLYSLINFDLIVTISHQANMFRFICLFYGVGTHIEFKVCRFSSGTRSVFVGFILTRSLSVKISAISSRAWASCLEQANIAMSSAHVVDTTLRFQI